MIKKLLLNSDAHKLKGRMKKDTLLPFYFLMVTLLFFSSSANAQGNLNNDYTFAQTIGSAYVDMVGGTSVSGPAGSSFGGAAQINATGIPIGFSFAFNNALYSTVTISDNGYITFGSTSPAGANSPISSTTAYNGAISGFGNNLAGNIQLGAVTTYSNDGADIKYQTTGSLGSQVFTVEYKNMKRRNLTTNLDGFLNFQIRLYEANMKIEVQYKSWTTASATSTTGQVGLRGLTTADFSNRIGPWSGTAAGGANNATIALSNAVGAGPAANTMFTWTPACFNATNLVTNLQVDNTTVNFSWTAPAFLTASFTNYIWEVRETVSGTTFAGPTTTALTNASVTGLSAGISYTFYVRSSCKPFAQSITGALTPLCSTPVYPYSENFESVTVPAIPNCTSTVVTTGAAMITVNNATPYFGFNNKNLKTASVAATDTWFFTRLISLTAGNVYKVSYKYGGSRELAQFNQKMQVKIGTVNTAAGMTTLIANHDAIKSSPNTFTFHFVAPGTGSYYLGFNGYAAFNNGYLQIDEISLGDPTCFAPTALTPASITYNSAIMSWTAPSPAPSAGYEYYISTSATAPISTSAISGVNSGTVTTFTGLSASTTYYVWVRSNCAGVFSAWSTVSSFTTLAPPPTPCTPAPSSVDASGITNVTFGSINNTTGAETGNFGNYTNLTTNISQTQSVPVSITFNTATFDYNTRIWIDWNNDGTFDNNVGSAELVATGLSSTTSPNTLVLSFTVPVSVPGVANTAGPHRMRIGGADINTLTGTAAGQGPCYNGTFGTFEDYSVYVTSPPPALTLSSASTSYCSGGSSPLVTLTAGGGSYDNFVWNPPVGVSGNAVSGWTFNPTTSGVATYTLTATQASGLFLSNTATYTITVYDVPTPVVFTPSTAAICEGIPTLLTSSGGIVSGALIFEENFNGPTHAFTAVNNSTGGVTPANAAWTLKNSPHLYASTTFVSNDSSQFIISNSDSQGSGGGSTTNTELISPLLDFTGYINVSLSYWQFYRGFGSGTADTQVWVDTNTNGVVDGAEVLTTVQTYSTASQGAWANFVNQIVDLSPWAGQSNVRLRFKYANATWAWYWALDNVKITGSGPALLTWAPTTNLWLDAAATIPYTGTPSASVYAKLSADQVYTATAASLAPPFCSTSSVLTLNVTKAGTASGNQTLSCGDTAISSNITLTGYVPNLPATIVGWQMADNPAFTGATTIPGSAGKDILTPSDVTGLSSTTYIRAMIQGCPTLFSNVITITYPTVTWNGSWNPAPPTPTDNVTVTSGTLTLSADLSVCTLKVNSGASVVVNPGVTLTVNGIVNVAATGTLTFLDDTTYPFSGAASLMQNPLTTTNANISSATNVLYNRTIYTRKFDYTYWSSPLSNTVLNNFASGTLSDKYIKFDSNAYVWTYPSIISTMTPGVGYGIRGPQTYSTTVFQESTHTFKGTPNNGDYNITVYNNSAGNDLNFLGNPYPSPLSADLLMDGNPGVLGALGTGTTFYFWTHNTQFNGSNYVSSDFATYNRTGGTLGGIPTAGAPGLNNAVPTGIISSGQGFMVRVVTPGTSSVSFKNSMRVTGSNAQFYRLTSTIDKSRLWLDLTDVNGDKFKQLLVGYVENATNAYENGFDGEILEAGNPISFYSIVDSKNLTIQGRALPFDVNDQVPLGYKTDVAGSYNISLSNTDGLFSEPDTSVYLEDTLLNNYHDLKSGPYTFVTDPGVFNNRFVLRYANLLNVNPNQFNDNDVVVFKQQDAIRIETSGISMRSVNVYDIQGRLVISKDKMNSKSVLLPNIGLASQVLMVQITSVEGEIVNKKIIF